MVDGDVFVALMDNVQIHVYGEKNLSNSSAAFTDDPLNKLKCIGRMSCSDQTIKCSWNGKEENVTFALFLVPFRVRSFSITR